MKKLCFAVIGMLTLFAPVLFVRAEAPTRGVRWLEGDGELSAGTTFGVPWQRGAVPAGSTFAMTGTDGKAVSMQSWPLAYWPDGSLKWTAHAVAPAEGLAGPLTLTTGTETLPTRQITYRRDSNSITINTGVIQCRIARGGTTLIDSISRDGKIMATGGKLVCKLRSTPDLEADGTVRQETFHGNVESVTVEQQGQVRAVVKITGKHVDAAGRAWLPFVVRLYFYAGSDCVRVLHTIIYDGDQNKDFISGLGLQFTVPLADPVYDRHVRFATDGDGVWAEAVRGLTGLQTEPGAPVREAQIAGRRTPDLSKWDATVAKDNHYIPAYGDFTLAQPTSNGFEIRKRTGADYTWLNSMSGHRAAGLGYIGEPSGGLAFGIRNFWQSYPAQLDIRHAETDAAEVTAWLWSPEARPMDLRPAHGDMGMTTYETENEGAKMTYEDYEPGYSTPTGIARTSELMLWVLPSTPPHEEIARMAQTLREPPLLVCRPQDYKDAGVFGEHLWDLPDRSTPAKKAVEDQLDFLMSYYERQVDERNWYGYWYFGNIMHRYDFDRHVWRYDIGGYAWDNSEQSTDMWLWYSFLRTGRADIFRFAEAMTRNTGEVDVYHVGKFAGLGSRHAVVPWGDSSKQLRVSTAENRRYYYYLTADERCGDLMREELNADRTSGQVPVERKVSKAMSTVPPGSPYTMNFLVGIEWTSMASAWLTEWERTGDVKWRDRLIAGMKSIAALPHGWFSGGGGYDPETGKFYTRDHDYYASPLSAAFGGFEVNAELLQLIDVPEYEKTWLQYCQYYNATAEEQKKVIGKAFAPLFLRQAHSRLTAYAAWKLKDDALAKRAWSEFFEAGGGGMKVLAQPYPVKKFAGPEVAEPIDEMNVSTNATVGFGLSAIEDMGLIGDKMPAQVTLSHTLAPDSLVTAPHQFGHP